MSNQNNDNNNNDNNFFNNNPLLAFAVFSIVIIMIFKMMVGDGEGLGSMANTRQHISKTKQVVYSDIKQYIKDGKIKSVKITPTSIEAIGEGDSGQN